MFSVLPQVVDGEFCGIGRSIHVQSQRTAVWFSEFPIAVKPVVEELVALFGDSGVDEDAVYAAEACVCCFETGALRGPGGDVALVEQQVRGGVGEGLGWGLQVEEDEVVGGV